MKKRWTDADKWDDPWFCSLTVSDRGFWEYIRDRCDSIGIWKVNMPLVKFYFGADYSPDLFKFGGRIIPLSDEKWLVTGFIQFQQGDLSEDCRPHQSIIAALKRAGLWEPYQDGWKGLAKGMLRVSIPSNLIETKEVFNTTGARDISNPTELLVVKPTPKPERRRLPFQKPTFEQVQAYCRERKSNVNVEAWFNHYESNGWRVGKNPMQNWQAAVRTWEQKAFDQNPGAAPRPTPKNGVPSFEDTQKMLKDLHHV